MPAQTIAAGMHAGFSSLPCATGFVMEHRNNDGTRLLFFIDHSYRCQSSTLPTLSRGAIRLRFPLAFFSSTSIVPIWQTLWTCTKEQPPIRHGEHFLRTSTNALAFDEKRNEWSTTLPLFGWLSPCSLDLVRILLRYLDPVFQSLPHGNNRSA